ncbi:MAG: HAD-IA family hydrolase [Anaerolineales bacterium]|nr:HAD-IA family hydrolase [Anaerolineales bacterium]
MIKALIFDFDGLILDTEWPDYLSWQRVYRQYGCELAVADWGQIVGGDAESDFDPYVHLEQLSGKQVDRDEIWISRRKEYLEELNQLPVLPGVLSLLDDAERRGLQLAVASSSPENWVRGHLARLGLYQRFEAIKTADDVQQIKPNPELYLAALAALGVEPDEAIVFEDSPNGVTAALAAGIFCVAVPNQVTAQLDLAHASLRLNSLAEMPLPELLKAVEA